MSPSSHRSWIADASTLPTVLQHGGKVRRDQPQVAMCTLKVLEETGQSGSRERTELTLETQAHLDCGVLQVNGNRALVI